MLVLIQRAESAVGTNGSATMLAVKPITGARSSPEYIGWQHTNYTNRYTNAARSRPQAVTHNREQDIQHSLCLCGFLPSDNEQRRTTRSKRSGIPLNGVSRVRIPPPPLARRFAPCGTLRPFGPTLVSTLASLRYAGLSARSSLKAVACQQRIGFASLSASRLRPSRQARKPSYHTHRFSVSGRVRPQLDLAESEPFRAMRADKRRRSRCVLTSAKRRADK